MAKELNKAQVNHLRRLLGWVRCEIPPEPEEIVKIVQNIGRRIYITKDGQERLTPNDVLRYRNGDIHDPRIENLEKVTRAEHLRRNWHDRYPLAIKRMVQLRGALQRQINKREGKREQHNQRPA